ncbi:MAG: hypothetical protein Q9P01_13225 [Anaerolineae bacterium]|nr:hypothetical protein [Anaerolineae bacterium]MDQ7035750.1 hypothetical protein [Anaerolineae bacterium]
MNTTQLIYEIACRSKHSRRPLTREDVSLAMDLLLDILLEELTKPEGEIRLRHIGILRLKKCRYSGGQLKIGQSPAQIQKNQGKHYYRLTLSVNQTLRQQLRQLP